MAPPKKYLTDHPLKMDCKLLLENLLHNLQEGIIVCRPDATINLFNRAAAELLGRTRPLIHGESLYGFCLRGPIEHGLEFLRYRLQTGESNTDSYPQVQLINATADQRGFFRCRLNFVAGSGSGDFAVFFEDISAWYRPDNLLFSKIARFRAPMTNLRAAVENITEHPEMSPVMRSAFENVLVQESLNLTEAFDSLDKACNHLMQTQSHLAEINSAALFGFLAGHFVAERLIFTATDSRTAMVRVDSYGLFLVLKHLGERIRRKKKLSEVQCRAHVENRFVYFDFFWTGKHLPPAAVESLLGEKTADSVGDMTVGSILHSMGGDIWSQPHDKSGSILRLALSLTQGPDK